MKQLLLSFLVSFSSFVYSQQNGKEELNNASTPAMSPMINNSFGNSQHKEMSDSIDYPIEENKSKERDAPFSKKATVRSDVSNVQQNSINQKKLTFSNAKIAANSQNKQRTPSEQQQQIMDQQVKELGDIDPNSFEYNLLYYSSGNYEVAREKALKRAEDISPNNQEVLKFCAANSIVKGDTINAKKYLNKIKEQGLIQVESIDYTQDLLYSSPENSTIITHGYSDSYGAYFNQLNNSIDKDKTVISLDFLQSAAYRKLLQKKGFKIPNQNTVDVAYLKSFCALNTNKNLYLSMTIPKEYFEPIQNNIFVSGLLFEYNSKSNQATAYHWLDNLWYEKMNKRVLNNYNSTMSYSLGMNYLPMLIYLQEFHKLDDDQTKYNQLTQEIIKIKKKSGFNKISSKKSE